MIRTEINISGLQETVDSMSSAITDESLREVQDYAANAVKSSTVDWYTALGEEPFLNTSSPTWGPGRQRTGWFKTAAHDSWAYDQVSSAGFTVYSDNASLALKITGGQIVPKRANFLTIPLVPEAHGRRASDFTGLFRPYVKGGGRARYLARVESGGIRAIYALRKSVTIKANRSLMPSEQFFTDTYVREFSDGLNTILETL